MSVNKIEFAYNLHAFEVPTGIWKAVLKPLILLDVILNSTPSLI